MILLRRLLGDADLRRRLGTRARATAQEYTVPKMAEAYRALYNRVPIVPSALRN